MLLYMYIAPGQAQTTPWGQMLISTDSPYHFAHLLQDLQSLWSMILNTFDFIHVYIPRAGTDNPLGTNFDVNRNSLSLCPFVASLKKKSLWSRFFFTVFLCVFFSHVPRQGQTTPWGQNFYDNRKAFSLCPYVVSFKRSLQNLILYTFLMILYMYIAPGKGQKTPWGQTFDVNWKPLSLLPFELQVSNKSLWILILYTFFNVFSTCI